MGAESAENFRAEDVSQRTVRAKPFIKWAGGKSRVLPEILSRLPASYEHVFEPFAGGAALYFRLAPERGYLSDTNADLVKFAYENNMT